MEQARGRSETPEQRQDRLLAEYDRTYVTWRGRTFVRNAWLLWLLAGLPVGVVLAVGLAVAGRGGLVVVTLLQLALLLLPLVAGVLLAVSLAAGGRGRRTAVRVVRAWGTCLGALAVLAVAAAFVDSGMRDVL